MQFLFKNLTIFIICLNSLSCVNGLIDNAPVDFVRDDTVDAIPANEPLSRYGNNPNYTVNGKTYKVLENSSGFKQSGIASWYGTKFHGKKTSSGEPYNMYAMTAAHKTLPLPTYVEVINNDNGRKTILRINDRGPFHEGRIIDLSYAAARKLGISDSGTGNVSIRAIDTSALDLTTHKVVLPMPITADGKITEGKLLIQVAAMGSEAAAEKMASQLRAQNMMSVRIHMIENDTGKLYRVRIGPIPTVDLAYKIKAELNEMGLNLARIVIDKN